MAFISKTELQAYGRGFSISNAYIAENQTRATSKYSWEAETTIFLSHSHKDRDLIEPAIAFLRSHGVKVYVDWMDEGMPDVVSGETAKKLKDRIKQQKKFLVMVTENSKDSRWVPWELGFADSAKGMEHIASFPVRDGTYDFAQNEYMKIYPKIYFVSDKWYVWTDDPTKLVELSVWFNS
jgi:TIR domain